ncbi:transcription initiation factor TFIID subunit 1-like isoform X1 [Asparagus officinalis]|uniref:transcription initiation factor TFIID subunit 1-like isoform X1 n=1 Tax=Asparagus officinalis TaxID=4686 RepID=UPI00098E005F|nr:transcription initiation factor TFIID subunit 1-like isoform X1 [Asparagus officinalis]
MVILKFSEIFGIHEPLRKTERKDQHRHSISKDRVKVADSVDVEEDEEVFLRSSCHDFSRIKYPISTVSEVDVDIHHATSGVEEQMKDSCLFAQPMKDDDFTMDVFACQWSSRSPNVYPLDQQDWEDAIVWGNSPTASHGCSESCVISELSAGINTDAEVEDRHAHKTIECDNKDNHLLIDPVLVEPFGSKKEVSESTCRSSYCDYHPQLLRLESLHEKNDVPSVEMDKENQTEGSRRGDIMHRFNKLSLQNKDLLDGSWLDQVIWDPDDAIPKPKLILDLQDEQMLFEIFDHKDSEHICSHAGAMVMMRPPSYYLGDSFDLHNQGMPSVGRFNISNDKYYSNRKTSQQAKSHTKKRSFHGIKVMHSIPALKLQTMKPKLSNKDIANFHRPKALWYPHDNEAMAKAKGMLCTSGLIKIIIISLGGGKGVKLHINADETLSTIKSKASKKLDFKPSEKVKVFYSGKELKDDKSLALQNVHPNSVLHLVRTKVHLWPRAQKLPGENKPLRPPGAFKKKSDLSVKDGHVFLMEYCEEKPLLLGNVGMGARLCTYYQKMAPGDQTASTLRNGNDGLGTVLPLEPSDKSPFLGDVGPGCSQSCLETNMYRAPLFPHKSSSTDYLLVRSAKGMLSLRRIDKLYSVGQQEPHMEVLSPGSKSIQTYLLNRMLVYVYREFRANEKPDILPLIRADDLASKFPGLTDAIVRKRLKHCADLRKGKNGMLVWVKRHDFRIPLEDELRRMLSPENVCSYESMQAGLYRLKRLGISRLTHPVGLSSAMNQLPDEAIALAAASHIERELQITPWNLTSNFVACTNQDKENIERLEITGVGDPSGRGLGFSYVRAIPKAPISNTTMKKKAASAKVGSTVTGTDADLRRLSMDAAREV